MSLYECWVLPPLLDLVMRHRQYISDRDATAFAVLDIA
jgi:hypothetical protein